MAGGWQECSEEATTSSTRLPCFKNEKAADSTIPCSLGFHPVVIILTAGTLLLHILIAQVEPCCQVQDNLMKPVSNAAIMETQGLSHS